MGGVGAPGQGDEAQRQGEVGEGTAQQIAPLPAATKKPRRWQGLEVNQGCNQAWGGVIRGAAMRLRRRRLTPKAAAAPNSGRGPGTLVDAGPEKLMLLKST